MKLFFVKEPILVIFQERRLAKVDREEFLEAGQRSSMHKNIVLGMHKKTPEPKMREGNRQRHVVIE